MQPNSSINITPGSGVTLASHQVNGKQHPAVILCNDKGYIVGATPTYRAFIPKQAVGANKVYFDLFNGTGSGKIIKVLSLCPIVSGAVAVSGTLGVELFLSRTSTSSGGTLAVGEAFNGTPSASITAYSIGMYNPSDSYLPAQITGRFTPTVTLTQCLSSCCVFTEETNAGTYFSHLNDLACRMRGSEFGGIVISEGTGIAVSQSSIASVGNIGFDMIFTVE